MCESLGYYFEKSFVLEIEFVIELRGGEEGLLLAKVGYSAKSHQRVAARVAVNMVEVFGGLHYLNINVYLLIEMNRKNTTGNVE